MSKYETIVVKGNSSELALRNALDQLIDSEVISHHTSEQKDSYEVGGDYGPGYTQYYIYYEASVIFIPGPKYIEAVENARLKEEAERDARRIAWEVQQEADRIEAEEQERLRLERKAARKKKFKSFWCKLIS